MTAVGRVVADVAVELPRPRSLAMLDGPDATHAAAAVRRRLEGMAA